MISFTIVKLSVAHPHCGDVIGEYGVLNAINFGIETGKNVSKKGDFFNE